MWSIVNDSINYKKSNNQNISEIYTDSLNIKTTNKAKEIANILNNHLIKYYVGKGIDVSLKLFQSITIM